MKFSARIPMAAALLVTLASTVGCKTLKARDQLVKGVQEFKAGHYEQAVNHFQNSIALDPNYDTAKLYLATAYSYQVVPGDTSDKNMKTANAALAGFNEVLAKDPNDLVALRQVASIHRNIKDFKAAKADELKILSATNGSDAEANYAIGQMDWSQAYANTATALAPGNDDGMGNPKKTKDQCAKITSQNADLVTEAIKYLQAAIAAKPNYDDAMAILNLTYRQKAELDCTDDAARKADLAQADQWVNKAMGAKKANEAEKEKKLSGGVDMTK